MLQYTRLAKKVFSDKKNGRNFLQDGLFKATNLENVIRGVLEDKLRTGGAKAKMIEEGSGGCKTQVPFRQSLELKYLTKLQGLSALCLQKISRSTGHIYSELGKRQKILPIIV